ANEGGTSINISDLNDGIYFIKTDGAKSTATKFSLIK
ncbi:T9SS type A sorting domain-containing protein, partial [Vibrio parahaemolyticus]